MIFNSPVLEQKWQLEFHPLKVKLTVDLSQEALYYFI